MSTYTQILYQIVFSTKKRGKTLNFAERDKLYRFIWGILKNKKCHVYRIGGVDDHIHILTHVHPEVALSSLVKDIKLASSSFIKSENLFQHFAGWQNGYGAFTYTISEKERLIQYVRNQEKHHQYKSFKEEYVDLLHEHGIEFEEKYLI